MIGLLGILFVLLFFTPSIILSGILTASVSDIFQKYIREKNERILLSLSRDVNAYIQLQQNTLEMISSIADFARFRSPEFAKILNRIVIMNGEISRIQVIDPGNLVIFTSPWNPDILNLDLSYQNHIRSARTSVGPHVSDVFVSPVTGAPTIAVSLTRPDGYIVSTSIDILVLNTFIYSSLLEGREYSFLLDDIGTYIAHPESRFVLERRGFEGWSELNASFRENSGTVQYRRLADSDLLAIDIPSLGWVAALSQPLAVSRDEFNAIQNASSLAIFLFMLVSLVVSLWSIYKVARPLSKLAIVAGKFSRGETQLALPGSMIWEVKQLTRSFSRMLNAVRYRESMLRELNTNLEMRVSQRTMALNESLESLRQAQSQLIINEKMAALGQLVAGVAHEMNTPLGVGVTASSALKDEISLIRSEYEDGGLRRSTLEAFLTSAADLAEVLHTNVGRAVDIIASLKQVAVDQQVEHVRQFEVLGYLRMLVDALRPEINKGSHTVVLEGDESVSVVSDPGYLSQIFSNLIVNSLVHGFDGMEGGTISIIVGSEDDGMVSIVFRDNGRGFRDAEPARIFDPFYTTRRGRGGTGLGLNIVYNLVTRNLGGTISSFTDGEPGVAFRIVFPKESPQHGSSVDHGADGDFGAE